MHVRNAAVLTSTNNPCLDHNIEKCHKIHAIQGAMKNSKNLLRYIITFSELPLLQEYYYYLYLLFFRYMSFGVIPESSSVRE